MFLEANIFVSVVSVFLKKESQFLCHFAESWRGAVGISEQVPSGTTSNHHLLKQDSLNSVSPKMATFASCYREVQIWKGN